MQIYFCIVLMYKYTITKHLLALKVVIQSNETAILE